MRASVVFLLCLQLVSCMDSTLIQESGVGRIYVQVLEVGQNTPEPGVAVRLLTTGEARETNSDGIVVYIVPAGHHTVRVYGLNHGGPSRLYEDTSVDVGPNERVVVTLYDCPVCD